MKELIKNNYKKIFFLIILLLICLAVYFIFKNNTHHSPKSEITIGEIDLTTYDVNGNIESGKTVILYDEALNELGRSVAGNDGKINYYKVPTGNYKLVKIDENGNEINSKEVKVNGGETTEVNL